MIHSFPALVGSAFANSSAGGPPYALLVGFYGFTFVVLPGVGALASATVLARKDWLLVTIVSTFAAIPIVGHELFARNVETTTTFAGALFVGAYLASATALLVRGGRDAPDKFTVGGVGLWTTLLVAIALFGEYVAL